MQYIPPRSSFVRKSALAASLYCAGVALGSTAIDAANRVPVNSEKPMRTVPENFTQTGMASMYDDAKGMTTAHRTLPKGTKLVVTNTKTGKSVCVTVTDRGPYIEGRIVDLSYSAGAEIGITRDQGVAPVSIRAVSICP